MPLCLEIPDAHREADYQAVVRHESRQLVAEREIERQQIDDMKAASFLNRNEAEGEGERERMKDKTKTLLFLVMRRLDCSERREGVSSRSEGVCLQDVTGMTNRLSWRRRQDQGRSEESC